MYTYNRTTTRIVPRVRFNPAIKKHRDIFGNYLRTRSWSSDLRFYLEWPYDNIPAMCQDKLTRYFLNVPRASHPWEEDLK